MPNTLDRDNPFIPWLTKELEARGWNRAELARRMNVQQSVLGNIIHRRVAMGADVAKRLAAAMGVSQYEVFRLAGLIDEDTLDDEAALQEIRRLLAKIEDDEERQRTINILEAVVREVAEQKGGEHAVKAKRSSRTHVATSKA